MPRSDLFPPDIMDKHAAFAGAINQYLRLVQDWEIRRFDPNQPRIPAGQPNAGQWLDENGGASVSDEALIAEAPRSDSPQAPPAAPNDGASRFQVSLRPADIPKPDDPLLSEAGRDPSAAMLARYARTFPTYLSMYNPPAFVAPRIGFPRSTDAYFIGEADATRPEGPYAEAYRFETFKALFVPALPKYEFHHIVEEHQYLYFTDRPNDPRAVNNSSNIVILPKDVHTCISAEYSTNIAPGVTLRESLRGQAYSYQYSVGLQKIKECESRTNNSNTIPEYNLESEINIIPGMPIPPIPPRLIPKNLSMEEIHTSSTWALIEEKSTMLQDESFDPSYLLSILEEFDDIHVVIGEKSTLEANKIVDKAWIYFRKFQPTEKIWQEMDSLLGNSRKMVRIWVATEMLRGGRKNAWPTFIADLLPDPHRAEFSLEGANREFVATSFASNFILFNHRLLEDLGVSPSLSEMEDQWIAEGRITRRFVRIP